MITLYAYPALFTVADNNPYGLKVYAFLKLAGIAFRHQHVFDASRAPRQQLPYIVDDGVEVGDSDAIVAHVTEKYGVTLDRDLTAAQQTTHHFVRRTLDDLYWVMSYSRWKDPQFWPAFRAAMLSRHPDLTASGMDAAREFNFKRYHFQGIGRFEPRDAYARGLADLRALAALAPEAGFVFGPTPGSLDAVIYGFLANILYYAIDTPLKGFVVAHPALARLTDAVHARVS